ncbi:MAG TPA: zinc-binding dehydrogenase [Candidatus Limnocylindria bacterium]|nr:zinc-binding dehydrogenase [Candidatus Limnocylindria bacterium]
MKAAVLKGINELVLDTVPQPTPEAGEVLVRLRAAALNHRDVWIKAGQYSGLKFPTIPGSDGAGEVVAVGAGVPERWVDQPVIINPGFDWGHDQRAQEPRFSILGLPKDGTLAEFICVPVDQIVEKPTHLTWEEAAALPLAGLTAYRALFTRAQLKAHERVLINGIGAGTALFALQFAVAAGAMPCVTSSSTAKLEKAGRLGAKAGALYNIQGWAADFGKHHGSFDVVVDSAGGPGFGHLLDLAAPGGRIVFFGATMGNPPEMAMRKIFWRQLSLLGSTMGSPADFHAMVEFVRTHAIKPVISHVFPFERVAEAFATMENGEQFGKIVVTL